jgi:hypothetical protein
MGDRLGTPRDVGIRFGQSQWSRDRWFASHLKYGCLCVRLFRVCAVLCAGSAALRPADPLSKESYRLCILTHSWS